MNTYLIIDYSHKYEAGIIIVVAENEDEAFSFINAKKDDFYTINTPDYRFDKTIPLCPITYPRYSIKLVGEKYNQYDGEL